MKIKVIASITVLLLAFGLAAPVRPAPKYSSITPILEGELATTANAASDPNENEANATTGWTASGAGSAVASISSDKSTGTYSIQYTSNGASNRLERSITVANNSWYLFSWSDKDTTGNTGTLKQWYQVFPGVTATTIGTNWTSRYTTQRSTGSSVGFRIWNETVGNVSLADNYSLRQVRTSSMFAGLQPQTVNAYVAANWNIQHWTQAGVVSALDNATTPQNFVIGYYDRANGKAVLDKCIAGVYTNLINTTTAHSVGASVEVRRAGTTFQLFYNGAQVGTDQTVSDAGLGYLYGAFSTYSGNSYTGLAFTENSTATPTVTNTYTPTATFTPTFTPLPSHTFTLTFTFTPTETSTPTVTLTPTATIPALTATYMTAATQYAPIVQENYPNVVVGAILCGIVIIVLMVLGVVWFMDKKKKGGF